MIDVYKYIAANNPRDAKRVIEDFGYKIRSNDLANNLRQLVDKEGDSAVHALMKIHPDADYFEEVYSDKYDNDNFELKKYAYLNASGPQENTQAPSQNKADVYASQGNTFIMVAALLLAAAIIVKK